MPFSKAPSTEKGPKSEDPGEALSTEEKSTVLVAENYTNPPRVQLDTRLTCGERLGSARAFGSDDQQYSSMTEAVRTELEPNC